MLNTIENYNIMGYEWVGVVNFLHKRVIWCSYNR